MDGGHRMRMGTVLQGLTALGDGIQCSLINPSFFWPFLWIWGGGFPRGYSLN